MKTLKILFLATMVAFFAACDKDDEKDGQNDGGSSTETEITYVVTTNVGGDTPYSQENISVIIDPKDGTVDMKMQKVKFAERMPEMDITIPGVTVSGEKLSGDGIIPTAAGGPVSMYTVTNLTGTMTDTSISVSMNCGQHPLSFSGTKK